jgi:hypothetical protein
MAPYPSLKLLKKNRRILTATLLDFDNGKFGHLSETERAELIVFVQSRVGQLDDEIRRIEGV